MRVEKGSTNVSVELYIVDDVSGQPELGVVFNTSGIDLNYRRDSQAVTSITEIDLTTPDLTDAHEDGGFLEIANGRYRLDVPDAAFATGANKVTIGGTVTGMIVLPIVVELIDPIPLVLPPINMGDFSLVDTMIALFPTYYAGVGVTVSALDVADIEVYKDGSTTQRTSNSGFAVVMDFDGITGVQGLSIDLSDDTDAGFFSNNSQYHAVINTVTIQGQEVIIIVYFTIGKLATREWNPDWESDLEASVDAALTAYNAMATNDLPANFASLPISPIGSICVHHGTADAGAAGYLDLETGIASSVDDAYLNMLLVTTGGTGANQKRLITDYEGVTNQRATVDSTWTVTPDATTTYEIHRIINDTTLAAITQLINQNTQ